MLQHPSYHPSIHPYTHTHIYIYVYTCSKVNIWNLKCVRQTALFSTHDRMFLRKSQSFRDRKCPDLKGTRTPNLRIHAECSNHLRCKDQKLAVPWHVSTLLFLIGGSQAPSNIFKINTIYVLMCCNIHTYVHSTHIPTHYICIYI